MRRTLSWQPLARFISRAARIRARPEIIISTCSAVIAIAAVWVTVWQAQAMMRHDRLMVKPPITIWRVYEEEKPCLRLELRNYGLGPAFVDKIKVLGDTKAYSVETRAQWAPIMKDLGLSTSDYAAITGEMIVPSGGVLTILKFLTVPGNWQKKIDHLGLRVRYRSAYDEKYLAVLSPQPNLKRD
jgi:hypothetical protein